MKLLEVHEGGRNEYAQKAEGYLNDMDNKFSTFFGLMLSHLIFSATEQLSITLQAMNTTMQDVVECSKLAISFLERQRVLNASILEDSKDLTFAPVFPRYRRLPRTLDEAASTTHRLENPKSFFCQQYYETLDLINGELVRRFQQKRGMPTAAALETLLMKSFNEDYA